MIEKADLIISCQYSPTGRKDEDLKLASAFMDDYLSTRHSSTNSTSARNISSASSSSETLLIIPNLRFSGEDKNGFRSRTRRIDKEIKRQKV